MSSHDSKLKRECRWDKSMTKNRYLITGRMNNENNEHWSPIVLLKTKSCHICETENETFLKMAMNNEYKLEMDQKDSETGKIAYEWFDSNIDQFFIIVLIVEYYFIFFFSKPYAIRHSRFTIQPIIRPIGTKRNEKNKIIKQPKHIGHTNGCIRLTFSFFDDISNDLASFSPWSMAFIRFYNVQIQK